ncbi:biotin/lipoyl-containing protein, partial [Streptomyces boncukensis]|nr:acety-l/propionyl-CoA carboxylase subunit alpha [Streptomyces boncukensis]
PRPSGHAVEARLYAEDPARDWRPQTGRVRRFDVPEGVRTDSGVEPGTDIGVHYDPLLAKVAAHAPTRAEAVRRLAGALERARLHAPATNRALLVRSLRHPEFTAAETDTTFYERRLGELLAPRDGAAPPEERLSALAAALTQATRSGTVGWRNVPSQPHHRRYRTEPAGREHEIRYRWTRTGALLPEDQPGVRVLEAGAESAVLELDGVRRTFTVAAYEDTDQLYVDSPLGSYTFTALPRLPEPEPAHEPGSLLAQLPGTVVRVAEDLAVGARVRAGQPLLWLEAMKMQHQVVAPAEGVLTFLGAETGQQVESGAVLAVVTS